MKPWLLVAVAGTFVHLAPAWAQLPPPPRLERVGDWQVQMMTDPSTGQEFGLRATVLPRDGGVHGMLLWSCDAAGLVVTMHLLAEGAPGLTRHVFWSFDGDRPDSTSLRGAIDRFWHLADDGVAPFTIRAKTAGRLAIQVVGASTARGTELTYRLRGAREALERLDCARNPSTPVRRAQVPHRPGEGVSQGVPVDGAYELSAVDMLPALTNRAEIMQLIAQGYPPELRTAGVTGRVTLRFLLLENGRVEPASVRVTASTLDAFNELAVQAVRRLVLTPARLRDRPVKVWVELPIDFRLDP